MSYNSEIHHRRSIRLKHYDYSENGAYFITVCTKNRECWFGDIVNGKMELSRMGEIVECCWMGIPKHFCNVLLDEFIIMPNHFHGILIIENDGDVQCRGGVTPPLQRYTLGQIIAYFKYQSTKLINKIKNTQGQIFWQRNYYEHIIRNETELNRIREYIVNNPIEWKFDKNNPNKIISCLVISNAVPSHLFVS